MMFTGPSYVATETGWRQGYEIWSPVGCTTLVGHWIGGSPARENRACAHMRDSDTINRRASRLCFGCLSITVCRIEVFELGQDAPRLDRRPHAVSDQAGPPGREPAGHQSTAQDCREDVRRQRRQG